MNNLPENITNENIIAYLKGEATNDESCEIQKWLESSEENKRYIEDLRKIWIKVGEHNATFVDVDVDKAWDKLSLRIDNEKVINLSTNKKQNQLYKMLLKVAAVLIPVIFISYIFFTLNNKIKQLSIVTTDKIIEKTLSDGSKIKINANTKFTYPEKFKHNIREVSLEGEAFFEVTPNNEMPFVIHSKDASIKVVGTTFNVKANQDNIEVIVKTGKVLLYSINKSGDTSQIFLVAKEKGVCNLKTKKVEKIEMTDENDMFWISKTLVFNKTELAEVLKILRKNYNVDIEIKNKELNKLKLSATFKDQSIESILEIISASFNLKISKTNTTFVINE